MVEIIPNWHPIFVHFTVGLLSLAVGLFILIPFLKPPLREQWRIVAPWVLWFGAGFTVITGLTGLYAYNTVTHDTPSHLAMTDHRNWAVVTMVLFLALALWSALRARRNQALGVAFIAVMAVAGGVLASTAWRGGEVVFRHGLGVMSLPKAEGDGHAHDHGGEGHGQAGEMHIDSSATQIDSHEHGDHAHESAGDQGQVSEMHPGSSAAASAEEPRASHTHDPNHSHGDKPAANENAGAATDGTVSTPGDHHHDDGHDHQH